MGGGPKNVTSTTETTPPDFLVGPLTTAANAAQGDFTQSGGNQLINQSQDLLGKTLGGDFLSPDSNPFLQQTFDRAAQLTRGTIDSEFASSGRDLSAGLPARSEELQTLASNIFGGNFARERGFQNDAIGQSRQFDPINILIDRLAGIIPGAGGTTQSTQPVFKTGLF